MQGTNYELVQLANGSYSLRALDVDETFHPVVGPEEEAKTLYLEQLHLAERVARAGEPFVIWDVGLGAAANVLTVVQGLSHLDAQVRVISFDHTLMPLKFAREHVDRLPFLAGFERQVEELIDSQSVKFKHGNLRVQWDFIAGDFPELLKSEPKWPTAHAIMFDAFSPATNVRMWTHEVFAGIFRLLDPNRACAMATYSRSTLLRVTLLLAGFYVGRGSATGEKEETTIASNALELIEFPLGLNWLERARRSTSAEPLWTAEYQQKPLSEASLRALMEHPQFKQKGQP